MKSWWKSKSIWVGALQIISSIALIAVEILNEGSVKVDMGQTLLMVNGVAMIILRWVSWIECDHEFSITYAAKGTLLNDHSIVNASSRSSRNTFSSIADVGLWSCHRDNHIAVCFYLVCLRQGVKAI